MKVSRARLGLLFGLMCLPAPDVWAVHVRSWHVDQPADLLAGTLENLSITNRAQLLLGPQVERYPLDAKEADTVNALAVGADGTLYVATGPKGIIYRVAEDAVKKVADLPEGQVFSLLPLPDGALLAGTGGTRGSIHRVEPDGKTSVFWQGPGVRYVWSMARDEDGTIYAATGTEGEIYRLSPDEGRPKRLARLTSTHNVLCLAMAGSDRLIFGTDGNGLVGAINTKTGRLRILYDAGQRSITSLAPQPDGTVYVTAARVSTEKPSSAPPVGRPQGHPDGDTSSQSAPHAGRQKGPPDLPIGTATGPSKDRPQTALNTVYRIEASGLTTEVVSLPAIVLATAPQGGDLIVSTGNPGRVYRIEPIRETYLSLLREDASYFTAIARAGSSYWVGQSRPAGIVRIKPEYAAEGTFTSAPLDAGLVSLWGQTKVDATLPAETTVTVRTRSSNSQDVTGPGWSEWSEPVSIADGLNPLIGSPPARFLQVRLTLKADGSARHTPLVHSTDVPYQPFNLPPEIASISVTTPEASAKRPASQEEWFAADTKIEIEWQARDPNGDALRYELYIRPVDGHKWTRIARNQTKTTYTWDSEDMADGRYELKVTANDAADNPPSLAQWRARVSESFAVDKSPPKIESVKVLPAGQDTFQVTARVTDKLSNIIAAQYAIDSSDEWMVLLPVDGIFDSPQEALDLQTGPLSPGQHVLTIRAADGRGNAASLRRPIIVGE